MISRSASMNHRQAETRRPPRSASVPRQGVGGSLAATSASFDSTSDKEDQLTICLKETKRSLAEHKDQVAWLKQALKWHEVQTSEMETELRFLRARVARQSKDREVQTCDSPEQQTCKAAHCVPESSSLPVQSTRDQKERRYLQIDYQSQVQLLSSARAMQVERFALCSQLPARFVSAQVVELSVTPSNPTASLSSVSAVCLNVCEDRTTAKHADGGVPGSRTLSIHVLGSISLNPRACRLFRHAVASTSLSPRPNKLSTHVVQSTSLSPRPNKLSTHVVPSTSLSPRPNKLSTHIVESVPVHGSRVTGPTLRRFDSAVEILPSRLGAAKSDCLSTSRTTCSIQRRPSMLRSSSACITVQGRHPTLSRAGGAIVILTDVESAKVVLCVQNAISCEIAPSFEGDREAEETVRILREILLRLEPRSVSIENCGEHKQEISVASMLNRVVDVGVHLQEENAKLREDLLDASSHQNTNQRIKYLMTLKTELAALQKENLRLIRQVNQRQ